MSLLERRISHASLIGFAWPTILSYVFVNIYFIIDGIFVSQALGTSALAAVNIVMPVFGVTLALATMIGTGGSALVASLIGEGKLREARGGFSLLVLFCLVSSGLLCVLGLLWQEPLLRLLGAEAGVYELCRAYLQPLLIATPLILAGMVLDNFFVVEGRPRFSMCSVILGGTVNVLLDYLFLFVWGMGIEGAALATSIGYSLSVLIGLGYFGLWRKGTLRLVTPVKNWQIVTKSMFNGMSEIVVMLAGSVIIIVMNRTLMELVGEDGVAAASIIQYTEELLAAVYLGYAEGIAPLMSYRQGTGEWKDVRRIYECSLHIISVFAAVTFLMSFLIAGPLIAAFAGNVSAVYEMAVHGFHIFAVSFLFMGFNTYSSSLFTALNDGRTSALLSGWHSICFLSCLLLLPRAFGLNGVWIAQPVAELLALFLAINCFRQRGFGDFSVFGCRKRNLQDISFQR
ncbi:MAG: MATE family efflux transporter [Selenomonadaceae bacterium]|nr:MATE family efflux transporter [Selenomonadaceae bacterium]